MCVCVHSVALEALTSIGLQSFSDVYLFIKVDFHVFLSLFLIKRVGFHLFLKIYCHACAFAPA